MAARKMMALVGGTANVMGSKMATPFTEPSPGIAPMATPRTTPKSAITEVLRRYRNTQPVE